MGKVEEERVPRQLFDVGDLYSQVVVRAMFHSYMI